MPEWTPEDDQFTERAAATISAAVRGIKPLYSSRDSFVWGQGQRPNKLYLTFDDPEAVDQWLLNLERWLSGRGKQEFYRGEDDLNYPWGQVYQLVLDEIARRNLLPNDTANPAARERTARRVALTDHLGDRD